MKTQIMLDLETLGTRPGSVITSIGAVKFGGGEITSDFYIRIDMQSSVDAGLVIDPATLLWWLQRSEKARAELLAPSVPLRSALEAFSVWVADPEAEVWGCGVGFDNVLLDTAYAYLQVKPPWKHWNDRCYRTLKKLHPTITLKRTGTHHHALDDARYQAMHLMKILNDQAHGTAGGEKPTQTH
jgi:hypothetical protein